MSKHLELLHRRHSSGEHIVNVNAVHDESLTLGQRIADAVASGMGSWPFIIIQSLIVLGWIGGNLWWLSHPYDPFPFILLNLLFSTQAAYAAPVIMMSQNRQAAKDRLAAEQDYHINQASKEEIEGVMQHLDHQDDLILQIVKSIEAIVHKVERQEGTGLEILKRLEATSQQKTKR